MERDDDARHPVGMTVAFAHGDRSPVSSTRSASSLMRSSQADRWTLVFADPLTS
jgi:hypothetical protein